MKPQNPPKSPAAATSHPTLTLVLNRNINADNHAIKLTQCSLFVPLLHRLPDSHCSAVSNADIADCTQLNRFLPILPLCTGAELTQDYRLLENCSLLFYLVGLLVNQIPLLCSRITGESHGVEPVPFNLKKTHKQFPVQKLDFCIRKYKFKLENLL